ncbi:hypothetical protein KKG46_05590 [Patescibacteria group bacterium]|nr:hypothetical protein [Patescibacteria group bacterium]
MNSAAEQMPTPQESSNEMNFTPQEEAFMQRANMTPAQLAQYKHWKELDKELGGEQVL